MEKASEEPKMIRGTLLPETNQFYYVKVTQKGHPLNGQSIRIIYFDNPIIQAIVPGCYLQFQINEEGMAYGATLHPMEKYRRLPFDLELFITRWNFWIALAIFPSIIVMRLSTYLHSLTLFLVGVPTLWIMTYLSYAKHVQPHVVGAWRWMETSTEWKHIDSFGNRVGVLTIMELVLSRFI